MFFSRPQGKRTTCNCRKSEGGTSSYNCMVEVRQLPQLMVPLLSVRVTNNTEKTFSIFYSNPSMSLSLSQHCTRHAQWATNMSMWACFLPTILHTLICCIIRHGKIGMSICLQRTCRLFNFHQTSFLFFETTWQILCASSRFAPHKNDVF